MLKIISFCIMFGIVIGAVVVLDIIAIKKANKVNLDRPDLIEVEKR